MMTNTLAIALCAILSVESRNGTDTRTGDGGRAVGHYQMWPVAVLEANRVERIMARHENRKARRWTLANRKCPVKSREMCETTMRWHYRRGVTDPVCLACRWRNPYSPDNAGYRSKVRKAVETVKVKIE